MLRRLMVSGPQLSRGLCDAIAACVALLYLAIYVNARTLLPEFIFRDADKIQAQIGGDNTYEGSSFDVVGHFYKALGVTGANVFVATLGVLFIWVTLRQTRRVGSLFVNLALIAPCLFFNLFVASKDTLVVLMALLLWMTARRWRSARTLGVALLLYLGYAVMIRNYFALIMLLAGGVWLFQRAALSWRLFGLFAFMVALAVLPTTVYYMLQHPRDAAVDYLVYGSPFGARTSFYNPFAPDSFMHFAANYGYSAMRLNLPILFSFDVKGLAMQGFIALMLSSCWSRSRRTPMSWPSLPGGEALACIVLGHIAVSMLFEPDLGSYARHLSAVSLLAVVLWSQHAARPSRVQARV
jgi:hypothetical protein